MSLNSTMPTVSLWVLVPGDFPTTTTDLRVWTGSPRWGASGIRS